MPKTSPHIMRRICRFVKCQSSKSVKIARNIVFGAKPITTDDCTFNPILFATIVVRQFNRTCDKAPSKNTNTQVK